MKRISGLIAKSLSVAICISLALADVSFACTALVPAGSTKKSQSVAVAQQKAQCSPVKLVVQKLPRTKVQKDRYCGYDRTRKWVLMNGAYRLHSQILKKGSSKRVWTYNVATGKLLKYTSRSQGCTLIRNYSAQNGKLIKQIIKTCLYTSTYKYSGKTGRVVMHQLQYGRYSYMYEYDEHTGVLRMAKIVSPYSTSIRTYSKSGRLLTVSTQSQYGSYFARYHAQTGKLVYAKNVTKSYTQVRQYDKFGRLKLVVYKSANYNYVCRYNAKAGHILYKRIVTPTYRQVWRYNKKGQLLQLTTQRGWQRIDTFYHYDKNGQLTGASVHDQRQFGKYSLRTYWIINGRYVIRSVMYYLTGQYYSYDKYGTLRQYVDTYGNLHDYGYKRDAHGRVIEKTLSKNGKQYYRELNVYNAKGELVRRTVYTNGCFSYAAEFSREYANGRLYTLREVRSNGWGYLTYYDGSCKRVVYHKSGSLWIYTQGYLRLYRDTLGRATRYFYTFKQHGRLVTLIRIGIRDDGYVSRWGWTRVTPVTASIRAAVKSSFNQSTVWARFKNTLVAFKNGWLSQYISATIRKGTFTSKVMSFTRGVLQQAVYVTATCCRTQVVLIKRVGGTLVREVVTQTRNQQDQKEKQEKEQKEKKEKNQKEKKEKEQKEKEKESCKK